MMWHSHICTIARSNRSQRQFELLRMNLEANGGIDVLLAP